MANKRDKCRDLIYQIRAVGVAFSFIFTFVAYAEEFISLDTLIKEAKENNPEIQALKQKYLSEKQKISTAKTWEYPQVGVEYEKMEPMFSISQMIPFPGKLALKSEIAENETYMTEQELNSKIIEVISMVKRAFWDYWLIDKVIEIYQENIELMSRFLNIAKTQYAIGKVTQADILKANTELAKMESMLIELEQDKISVQSELNALLNRKPGTPLGRPQEPEDKEVKYTIEELEKLAIKNNPDIKSKEFLYQRNVYRLKLANREWFPDIMIGTKFSEMGTGYMLQIGIPLYYKKQTSMIKSMEYEKNMTEWGIEAIKVTVSQQVRDLWTKYESKKESMFIYETSIIPLAKQSLEITESGYRAGRSDFLDLLDSQKRYLEYNIEYYTLVAGSKISLAEIERIIGIELGGEK